MKWVKLTSPNGTPIWVNLALIVEVRAGEFWETGRITTRLSSGHVAYAADGGVASKEYFTIDVAESPEDIFRRANADLVERGIAA